MRRVERASEHLSEILAKFEARSGTAQALPVDSRASVASHLERVRARDHPKRGWSALAAASLELRRDGRGAAASELAELARLEYEGKKQKPSDRYPLANILLKCLGAVAKRPSRRDAVAVAGVGALAATCRAAKRVLWVGLRRWGLARLDRVIVELRDDGPDVRSPERNTSAGPGFSYVLQ